MCSNVPHAKRRSPAQAHISFAMTILLVVGAAATVVLRPEDNNGMDLDVFGESDDGLQHLSWAAVPLKKTPRRGRNRRLQAGPDVATEGDQPPTRSEELGRKRRVPGGQFGLFSDWHEAVAMPGQDGRSASLRGESCQTEEKQNEVDEILRKAKATPDGNKVSLCVRTKDSGRFLPEWIAFHYAVGVNEITVYDDDSVDDTKQILQPFVDAGLVVYLFDKMESNSVQMRPINNCLKNHVNLRKKDGGAPQWLFFHDVDEYIFPTDTNATISQALMRRSKTCCLQVPRVQYGTGGYHQMPQGLLLEAFLRHANPYSVEDNRRPKAVVNLDPVDPSLGRIHPRMKGMHTATGCECEQIPVSEIRINHYLGSAEDYVEKTKRFWQSLYRKKIVLNNLRERDVNDETSDTILKWACATREILYRVVEGIDTGFGSE